MQFELIESPTPQKAVLHVKKASVGFMNALRRTILTQLPCFAINEVDMYENNSALYSEYIANRLGLLPLTFSDEVAADARISLTLNVQGPCTVYSRDLVSAESRITPVNGDFPLAELQEDQRLRFEAFAVLGAPHTHAKFQSATASYMLYPEIELKKNSPKVKEFLAQLPSHIFDAQGNVRPHHSDAVLWFIERNPELGSVKNAENEFIFQAESFNNLTALEQIHRALALMKEQSAELKKLVSKGGEEKEK